jgi:hypothetical protein
MKRTFSVSTDSAFYNVPADISLIYGPYSEPESGFIGVEALGWRYLPTFISLAKKANLPIAGIHGRVGPKHGPILSLVNQLFIDTPSLVHFALKEDFDYVLLHVPEVVANLDFLKKSSVAIRVEGVSNPDGGLKKALELVSILRSQGATAILNPDIAHLYLEENTLPINSEVAVEMAINFISKIAHKTEIAIHLPIGEDKTDSINVFQVPSSAWKKFGQLLDEYPQIKICVENQWGHNLWINHKFKIKYREATIAKMDHLASHGVI